MYNDNDIKIAGNKPSVDVKRNRELTKADSTLSKSLTQKAKLFGKEVAQIFIKDAKESESTAQRNIDMLIQRRLLLSFTATIGFEQFITNDALSGVAQKSFLDTVKSLEPEIFKTSEDTGAFSFYYLAFRRGGEIDRRIGQTFAMLCSHDGDPIFQELGEALYCWFLSQVKSKASEFGFLN